MELNDQLIELNKSVGTLTTKVDSMQKTLEEMRSMQLRVNTHDTQIDSMKLSLQRGEQRFLKMDEKFDKLDTRIDKLEQASGEAAKDTLKRIWQYVLIALVGAIVSNIPTIIQTLAGAR